MESIAEAVRRILSNEYKQGATYKQLAKKYGISYAYIRGIITGEYPASGLTLGKLTKILPLSISSSGYQEANGNSSCTITQKQEITGDRGDSIRLEIFRGVSRLEICPECKGKVLALLAEI